MSTKPMSNKEKQRLRAERAAAALKEKQRRERRRQILTAIGVVVAIALIVGAGFAHQLACATTPRTWTRKIAAAGQPSTASPSGSADAPHKVVIYEDFLCPFCGEFETAEPRAAGAAGRRGQGAGRVPAVRLARRGSGPTPRAPR